MKTIRNGALVLIRGRFPKRYSTNAVLVWLDGGWPAVRHWYLRACYPALPEGVRHD